MRDSEGATGAGGAAEWPEGGGTEPLTVVDGRYAIERELGRGGSAVVYLARDVRDDSRVALKLLHQEFSGSKAAERFSLEVRLLREFEHPAILSVTDAGEWQGRPFYVMPFVDGESLQDRLRRERRLPFDQVVRIGRRLCDALAYAHERKVVHRDVKPANVMLASDAVYLTDFGVAKALEPVEGAPHSTTGVARGTRAYMSPEQLTADRDLDQRSDIFSLGCVLYEMIAGVRPYASADEGRELMRRLVEAPDPLKRHRDGVPPGLEAVVMKALAREPADRWQGVGEVGEGLGGRLEHRRTPNRRSILASLAVGGGVLLIALRSGAFDGLTVADPDLSAGTPAERDTRVVAFQVEVALSAPSPESGRTAARLQAAIHRAAAEWSGLRVVDVDAARSDDASRSAPPTRRVGESDAQLGEVRIIAVRPFDATRPGIMTAQVRDISGENVRLERSIVLSQATDSVLQQSAHELLVAALRADVPSLLVDRPDQTRSIAALTSFQRGAHLLSAGKLDSALLRFVAATRFDSSFSSAHLWVAQTISWSGTMDADSVVRAAGRAAALASHAGDHLLVTHARAVALLARAEFDSARSQFEELVASEQTRLVGLIGAGDCELRDSLAVPDVRSTSGLRFRSDWNSAIERFEEALPLLPRGLQPLVLRRLTQLVVSDAGRGRIGYVGRDRRDTVFALPGLVGSVVRYNPFTFERVRAGDPGSLPGTVSAALEVGRGLRLRYIGALLALEPEDVDTRIEYATLLESLGEIARTDRGAPTAWMESVRALSETSDKTTRARLVNTLVRLAIKQASVRAALSLADSALRATPNPSSGEARWLLGLAALRGDHARLSELLEVYWSDAERERADFGMTLGSSLRGRLASLWSAVATGICGKELSGRLAGVERALEAAVEPRRQPQARSRLLFPIFSAMSPCTGGKSALLISPPYTRLVQMQRAIAVGNVRTLESIRARVDTERSGARAADITWDVRYQEMWVLAASGDSAGAVARLDDGLNGLPHAAPYVTTEYLHAGSLRMACGLFVSMKHRRPSLSGHQICHEFEQFGVAELNSNINQ